MSGYLHRLVARHAESSAVRPRGTSRFEGGLVGNLGARQAEASAAFVSAIAAPSVARLAAKVVAVASDRVTHLGPASARSVPTTSDGRGEPIDAVRRPVTRQAEPARTAVAASAPDLGGAAVVAAAEQSEPSRTAEARVAPVESRARPEPGRLRRPRVAEPASPEDMLEPPTDGRSADRASEPDEIRVHIGRVDVRAVMASPEPARPAARPSRSAPMSLERYLSGERRA